MWQARSYAEGLPNYITVGIFTHLKIKSSLSVSPVGLPTAAYNSGGGTLLEYVLFFTDMVG